MMKAARATGLERLELERLRDQVGRLYAALQEATLTDAPAAPGAWSPPVDLCETEKAVIVRVELPGVRAEQIKVALTNTRLRICGEKKRGMPRSRVVTHLCSERSYGHFSRAVPLRWTINVNAATAELKDGILIVQLPKLRDRRGAEFKVSVKDADEEI
jgi:HSP20 family protein